MVQVGIATLSDLELLIGVVNLLGKTVVISLQSVNFSAGLIVVVAGSGELPLSLVKLVTFVVQVMVTLLDQSADIIVSLLLAVNLTV